MHNLLKVRQFNPKNFMINFKCPVCSNKVDLSYVVEKKGDFACIDCYNKGRR